MIMDKFTESITEENQLAMTSDTIPSSDDVTSNIATTEEHTVAAYDYFDINDRLIWMLNTPQQVSPLFIGLVAVAANALCLVAVLRVRDRWTNLHHFMFSLMLSDILVCVSVMAHVINWVVNPLHDAGTGPWDERLRSTCMFIVIKSLNTMGLNITLLNLVGMAFDHYVAILIPFRYTTLLNKRRSRQIILLLWLIAMVTSFSDMASPLWFGGEATTSTSADIRYNYCELVWMSPYHEEYTLFAIALVCFCVMFSIYLKIYCAVRTKQRRHSMYQTSNGRVVRERVQHNTRALLTTLLILGTFAIFWLPMCIFQVTLIILTHTHPEIFTRESISTLTTVDQYLYVVVLFNTLCDPVIYAIRIRDVRHGIVLILVKFLPERLGHQIKSTHDEARNVRSDSISLLSERRGTQVSASDSAGATADDKEHNDVSASGSGKAEKTKRDRFAPNSV